MCGGTVPFWAFRTKIEAFLTIDPLHTLMVVLKAFPSQKDVDAPEPVTYPYGGYLVHSHAKQFIATPLGLVIENALMRQYEPAATLDGAIVLHPDVINHPTFSGRSQNFFSARPVKSVCQGLNRPPTSSVVNSLPRGSSTYVVQKHRVLHTSSSNCKKWPR